MGLFVVLWQPPYMTATWLVNYMMQVFESQYSRKK